MGLAHLHLKGYDLPAEPRLAVVGTPCEVQGLRAMQANPWWHGSARVDTVVLAIALLCTKSFDYEGLILRELRDQRGLDLGDVGRVDVIHGRLIVEDRAGREMVREPIKDFHGAALKGCDECADFLGRGADISVGTVGSPDGWSSVLVRTDTGARAFDLAAPGMERAWNAPTRWPSSTPTTARSPWPACAETSTPTVRCFGPTRNTPTPTKAPTGRRCPAADDRHRHVAATRRSRVGRHRTRRPRRAPRTCRAQSRHAPPGPRPAGHLVRPRRRRVLVGRSLVGAVGHALRARGVTREALGSAAAGYRQELWLWLMGERTWDQYASPPVWPAGSAGAPPAPAPPHCPTRGRTMTVGDADATELAARLVAATGDAIVIADPHGRILLWNAGAEAMFGYAPHDALGASLDIIIPERLRARHWEGYHQTMRSGVTRYADELLAVPGVHRDGTRLSLEFSVTLLTGPDGQPQAIGAIIRDVTQRWRSDKALRDELTSLRQIVGGRENR